MEKNKSQVENTSANMIEDGARKIAETEYGLSASQIVRLNGYDDFNFHLSPPLTTNNDFHESQLWPHGYTLKIVNPRDSKNRKFFDEYVNVLLHLNKENFPCPRPIPNKDGKYLGYWTDGSSESKTEQPKNSEPRKHIFILLTFLQGEVLERFKYSPRVDISLGHLLSQLHTKLKPFFTAEGLHRPDFMWALHSAPNAVEQLLHVITDEDKQSLVSNVIHEFRTIVIPNLDSIDRGLTTDLKETSRCHDTVGDFGLVLLKRPRSVIYATWLLRNATLNFPVVSYMMPPGVIHGDLNLGNVLAQRKTSESENVEIAAIIDFTDMHNSYWLFDLAVTACYISLHDVDHYEDRIASLLSGYKRELSDLELHLLKICICTRLCQSITIGTHTLSVDPHNEYIKNGESLKYGWTLLERLSKFSHTDFNQVMRSKIEFLKNEQGI